MIKIQTNIFDEAKEISQIRLSNLKIGALVTFSGIARDFSDTLNENISSLHIEHYDRMTQNSLELIESKAKKKWSLDDVLIIHRVGTIIINEPIVLIVVASKHRDDAFDACRFIIDYLKVEAPFWKKEVSNNQSFWVEQKSSDLVKVK